jgi:hypothetical protein
MQGAILLNRVKPNGAAKPGRPTVIGLASSISEQAIDGPQLGSDVVVSAGVSQLVVPPGVRVMTRCGGVVSRGDGRGQGFNGFQSPFLSCDFLVAWPARIDCGWKVRLA